MNTPQFLYCYDSEEEEYRYTAVFTKGIRFGTQLYYPYMRMGDEGEWNKTIYGETVERLDESRNYRPEKADKLKLGKRIHYHDLPEKHRDLVLENYLDYYPPSSFE